MENFEELLRKDLHQFLLSMKEVDNRMPECPDVEEKWEEIAKAYVPDGIREFQDFPSASLCWMMYIGMAVAKMWWYREAALQGYQPAIDYCKEHGYKWY